MGAGREVATTVSRELTEGSNPALLPHYNHTAMPGGVWWFQFFSEKEREKLEREIESEKGRAREKKVLSISQNIEWDQRTCQEALAWIWMMREEQGGLGGLGGGGRENKPNCPCQPHSRQIKHSWDTSTQTLWWQNKRGMQPNFTQAEGTRCSQLSVSSSAVIIASEHSIFYKKKKFTTWFLSKTVKC